MNELLRERLISLLSDASQVANGKMQTAYGDFMKQVKATVSQSEQNYPETFRILSKTCIELVFVELLHRYEQGGKCPKICLYSENNPVP